jgi:hypothetical protein
MGERGKVAPSRRVGERRAGCRFEALHTVIRRGFSAGFEYQPA